MQISCTQCGGAVDLQEGAHFTICPYCSSALYVDKSKVVFHFVVTPTITAEDAAGKLRRWMAGNETVKDLDSLATISSQELIYFPMWRFVSQMGPAQREHSQPASAFAIPDIKNIPLSGGDLKFFSPKNFSGIPLKEPEVLLDSALSWLEKEGVNRDWIKEINLIHIPFYLFKYQFQNNQYQAIVDGSSGRVLASIFPAKAELPFIGIAILAAIVFFIEGLIAPNFFIRIAVFLFTAVPMGVASYMIARKY